MQLKSNKVTAIAIYIVLTCDQLPLMFVCSHSCDWLINNYAKILILVQWLIITTCMWQCTVQELIVWLVYQSHALLAKIVSLRESIPLWNHKDVAI